MYVSGGKVRKVNFLRNKWPEMEMPKVKRKKLKKKKLPQENHINFHFQIYKTLTNEIYDY